jgi:murein DD-endopeptidase MepM/ murein hydrolase activator NlpD
MSSIPSLDLLTGSVPSASSASATPEAVSEESFRQILALLMLGSSLNAGGSSSLSTDGLFLPLIGQLLEKLLADEISNDPPSGTPLVGRLTQGSHAGHVAIDFGVPTGTPVRATIEGRVIEAGWDSRGYGNLVVVENGSYQTYYAHLSEIPVAVGQAVQAGEVIGLSGNTGNSTGPHLHYEIRYGGRPVNPTASTLD